MNMESFAGLEEAEGSGSAESAEKFREKMRKNAVVIRRLAKKQKKQSAQEDKLAALLAKALKDPQKDELVFLIVKLLAENVPGAFILSLIAISDPNLKQELGAILKTDQAPFPEGEAAITPISQDPSLPPNVRTELNDWGSFIIQASSLMPGKTLSTVLTPDQKLKSIVLDLLLLSLKSFFFRNGLEIAQDQIQKFALLSIQSVLIQLRRLSQEKTDAERIESE